MLPVPLSGALCGSWFDPLNDQFERSLKYLATGLIGAVTLISVPFVAVVQLTRLQLVSVRLPRDSRAKLANSVDQEIAA